MKNIAKKIFIIVFVLATVFGTVKAEENNAIANVQIGDYVQLGKYKDIPIVWRYIDEDENGKLMLTKNVLCNKPFGLFGEPFYDDVDNNIWEKSFLREWLNSTVSKGEVDWGKYILPWADIDETDEAGFLNEKNFSVLEKTAIKSVGQWTMLPEENVEESQNGIYTAYNGVKRHIPGNPRDGGLTIYYEISEFPQIYHGAASYTIDKVFLLDEMQVYHMWENIGDLSTRCTQRECYRCDEDNDHEYSLRTPLSINLLALISKNRYTGWRTFEEGVRPAFYLDEENAVILSGSGTEEDPYILTGKSDNSGGKAENSTEQPMSAISVFCNDSEISFDQLPFIENDRVLVPMRAIFENLGAEVTWEESTQTITATRENDTIVMQIGNKSITKNDKTIESDVAPRIVGDRTFVPIRVISESLEATVTWDEATKTVTVIKE